MEPLPEPVIAHLVHIGYGQQKTSRQIILLPIFYPLKEKFHRKTRNI
jgi:hypothetical protein